MNWYTLVTELLPIVQSIIQAIQAAQQNGKDPAQIKQVVTDHMALLPAVINEA